MKASRPLLQEVEDPPRVSSYPLVSVQAALATIADSLQELPTECVSPRAALGRVLGADVYAPMPLPPFPASIKDGYAVVASSTHTPTTPFQVVGQILAGTAPSTTASLSKNNASTGHPSSSAPPVLPGQCMYITTGAPLPPGADAVVMVEHSSPLPTTPSDSATTPFGSVLFNQWVSGPGADVRPVGCDVAQDQIILHKGTVLGAAEIGILIGCGVRTVHAVRRVRIGVISTGNEIVDPHDPATLNPTTLAASGRIIDSNRPMLLAAIVESLPFCEPIDLNIVSDDYASVYKAISTALESCDILVTSGGVSMGSRDVVKPVLEQIATIHFGRVRMKPGKPLTFAVPHGRKTQCVIGLPGNPVSAFVCFHLAVTVAAKTLAGWPKGKVFGSIVDVFAEHDFKLDPERPEYHRVTLRWESGKYFATSTGPQASSRLLSTTSAHALLMLPAADGVISSGTMCKAFLLKHP